MTWLVLLPLAVNVALLVLFCRSLTKPPLPQPTEPEVEVVHLDASDEEIARAGVELHRISSRLDTAWTKHRLKNDAHDLRRNLAEELRRIEVLEGRNRE
ncbi:MAG TPA: hypothetical protein VFK14_12375 [Solirubrobacterales bacterium]|nr:hypothetical protein [Solirubrobacterales bacterium]